MRKRTRYRKRKASKPQAKDATVYRQIKGVQLVAIPVESLFSPKRNLRGAWARQTVEKSHPSAAKAAARAIRFREVAKSRQPPKTCYRVHSRSIM